MSCQKSFFKKLRERGLRLTPQREMVLTVMHKLEGFATAEEIYEGVQTFSSSVDISTIYRTLDLFQDFHVISTVDPGDGQRRYRLADTGAPRLHLVCRACGKVIGVDLEPVQSLAAYLKEREGFEADLDRLSIPGLCRECRVALD
jgi:Fur family ferric uptake transcriptional regulator